ncbi:MAG: hypothetical protein WCC78_05700, partial [Terriglobales bacterium]
IIVRIQRTETGFLVKLVPVCGGIEHDNSIKDPRQDVRMLQVLRIAVIIHVEVEKPNSGVNSVRSKVSAVH